MKIQNVKYRSILAKRNEIEFLKRVVNRFFSALLLFWVERICVLRVTADNAVLAVWLLCFSGEFWKQNKCPLKLLAN